MLFTDSHGENGKIDSSDSHHEDSSDSTDEIGSEAHQQREDRAAEQTHDHKSADLILTLRLMKHGLGENDGENVGVAVAYHRNHGINEYVGLRLAHDCKTDQCSKNEKGGYSEEKLVAHLAKDI